MSEPDIITSSMHNNMMAADAWYWAQNSNITLQGGVQYSTLGHEYQIGILQCDHPKQVFKKGAQLGVTETMVLKILHNMIYRRYPIGALYLFPTEGDVSDFSKARFKPLIDSNQTISSYVRNTDATNIKQINESMLYLRGARASSSKIEGSKKSSSSLKSIPVDAIVYDEFDEMDPEMIHLADERISHSSVGDKFCVGTPTVPDHGVDHEYSKSDQRVWMIKCQHCNEYTCAELEFPEYIRTDDAGRGYKCCKKCGREIFTRHGEWVAQRPSITDSVGWWISQLNSPAIDPAHVLRLFNNPPRGNIGEVYNSKLGIAYIKAENRLTKNEVLACCTLDLTASEHEGPCAMGVDVGNTLHYVIGVRKTGQRRKIIKVGKCTDFRDLLELERKYNVKCTVIDANPDTHAARTHQRESRSSVYLCNYVESQSGDTRWIPDEGRVTVNRNEILDLTHNLVVDKGRLELPRLNSDIDEYSMQMTMIAKTYIEDTNTGILKPRYIKLNGGATDDHYRHATGYFELACENISDYSPNIRQGGFNYSVTDLTYAITD